MDRLGPLDAAVVKVEDDRDRPLWEAWVVDGLSDDRGRPIGAAAKLQRVRVSARKRSWPGR
jgi:Wax ester synthase/diacylglycerol acyltransferase catalytic domain